MKAIGIIAFLFSALAFGTEPPEVTFTCEITSRTPYEKCTLNEWRHEVPILGLPDLNLDKEVIYSYSVTENGQCPSFVKLRLEVQGQTTTFDVNHPEQMSFVIAEGGTTALLSDEDPKETFSIRIGPRCKGVFSLSQKYTVTSLNRSKDALMNDLKHISREVSAYKELIELTSKTNEQLQQKLDSTQDKLNAIEATLKLLDTPPPDLVDIQKDLQRIKNLCVDIKSQDKTQREEKHRIYREQLDQKIVEGNSIRDKALRLMSYLSGATDLEEAIQKYSGIIQ